MDVHSPGQRSYNMSRIKNKNTRQEILVRKWLWSNGYRYRLHYSGLPGKPDIVFPGQKKVIFMHGCFWHRHSCRYFKWPTSNAEFWRLKIESNVRRDSLNFSALKDLGWSYLIIWECTFKGIPKSYIAEKMNQIGNMIQVFTDCPVGQCMEIDIGGVHRLNTVFGASDE